MEEEYKGKVALFEKMLQDLAWHVLEEQREDFRGSKTFLLSRVQMEESKEASLGGFIASKPTEEINLDSTANGRIEFDTERYSVTGTMHCISSSLVLPYKFKSLSLNGPASSTGAAFKSLSFSSNTSLNLFSRGVVTVSPLERRPRHSIVCEAETKKKADSAAKRARQAEKRRVYNKARKSEIRTRMKKVLEELDALRKKSDAQPEEVLTIEKLIAEAYSSIDKAVKVGTLHRNTGARRKSRLARRKKAIEIHHGWYVPAEAPAPTRTPAPTA
ncbi:hypothetical protein M9H77_21833 [Catharanthus roseus]|uniref:Uncharacterized protein n=1 Tax=Catharanthus roseus TaxID=4058 RepID=A0ACC0AQH6_CATRO|nr:hypothetical protein M9H77_21833 [Catharanthus roseus]